MVINCLEVYDTAWTTVSFWCYNHPTIPGNWDIQGNSFNHTKSLITVKSASDSISPVDRYRAGVVDGDRFGIGINKEPHGGHAGHGGKDLSFTTVEPRGFESVQNILLEDGQVVLCWFTW